MPVNFTMLSGNHLPSSVICTVLKDWVETKDVGKFDSAMCSRFARPQFTAVVSSAAFALEALTISQENYHFVSWVVKRKVKVRRWIFRSLSGVLSTTISEFVEVVGGPHVRSLDVWDTEEKAIVVLTAANFACKRIAKVCACRAAGSGRLSASSAEKLGTPFENCP